MLKRKNVTSFALLFISILTSLLFVGCGKKPEEKPQPTPSEEKRICSFSISNININSSFSLDDVFIIVRYGINSANLENYKAVFIAHDANGKAPSVLQCIESVDKDDYSFTVSDGKYNYKKESTLHFESSFFDRTDGAFFLSLCLFDKTDNTMEFPITGYQYALKYAVTNGEISFEIKGESVIRNH